MWVHSIGSFSELGTGVDWRTGADIPDASIAYAPVQHRVVCLPAMHSGGGRHDKYANAGPLLCDSLLSIRK